MRSQKIRLLLLLLVLVFMTYMGYRHQSLGGGPNGSPPVDALCPFGGVEGAFGWAKDGTFITRLAPSSLVLFGALAVVTLILGRVFCGWICPMGAISEFSRMAGVKLGIEPVVLPKRFDTALRYLKYVLLTVILVVTWRAGFLFFRQFDPWMAWMHLSGGAFGEILVPLSVLGLVIISGLFIERAWCRYLCPLGACFGLLQKLSMTKVHRDAGGCADCAQCDSVCPSGLKLSRAGAVTHGDCIACGRCVEECPTGACLSFKFKGGVMTPMRLGSLAVILFAALLGGAAVAGYWQTTAPTGGPFRPDQVRGWMTLRHVSEASGVPIEKIREASGLPTDFPDDKRFGHDFEVKVNEGLTTWFKQHPPAFSADSITGAMTIHELGQALGIPGRQVKEIASIPSSFPGDRQLKELGHESMEQAREKIREWLKSAPAPAMPGK